MMIIIIIIIIIIINKTWYSDGYLKHEENFFTIQHQQERLFMRK